MKCPFTVLSALFLFFRTLPYDSKLFLASHCRHCRFKSSEKYKVSNEINIVKRKTNLKEMSIIAIIANIHLFSKNTFQIYYQSLLNIKSF